MYFLTESRRCRLIDRLVKLGMPEAGASRWAAHKNDLRSLDKTMSSLTIHMRETYKNLKEATLRGNLELMRRYEVWISFDLTIFNAYADQVNALGLKADAMPRTTENVQQTMKAIDEITAFFEQRAGHWGRLH